jgi:hypothetical protein
MNTDLAMDLNVNDTDDEGGFGDQGDMDEITSESMEIGIFSLSSH